MIATAPAATRAKPATRTRTAAKPSPKPQSPKSIPGIVVALNGFGSHYDTDSRGRNPKFLAHAGLFANSLQLHCHGDEDAIDGYAIHKPFGRFEGDGADGKDNQLFAFPQDDDDATGFRQAFQVLATSEKPIDFYGGFRPTGTYDDPGVNLHSTTQMGQLRAVSDGFRYFWFDRSRESAAKVDTLNARANGAKWGVERFGIEAFAASDMIQGRAGIARVIYPHAPWHSDIPAPEGSAWFAMVDSGLLESHDDVTETLERIIRLGYRLYVLPFHYDAAVAAVRNVRREIGQVAG